MTSDNGQDAIQALRAQWAPHFNAQKVKELGVTLAVYRCQPDGRWQCVADMWPPE